MTRDPSGTNETGLHEITSPSEVSETSAAPAFVQVAQASAASALNTPPTPPTIVVIKPGPGNIATLPTGTSLAQVQIEGDNIVLLQPDGSRIVIEGGALDIPTFVVDGAEIPQEALALAFKASDIDVAAGPDGSLSVVAPGLDSGGSNFAQDVPGIGDAGPPIDLLAPTALQFDALEANEPGGATNIGPSIVFNPGGVLFQSVRVDEDALGGVEDGDGNGLGDTNDFSPPVDPDGTDPHKNSGDTEIVTGAFQLSDPDGVADLETLTITPPGGVPQTFQISSLVGSQVQGAKGILTITSYNPATGVGTFEYELTDNVDGPTADNGENTEFGADSFVFVVSDGSLDSAPATLNVDIVDDVPQIWTKGEGEGQGGYTRYIDEDDISTIGNAYPGESLGTSPDDGTGDDSNTGDPNDNNGGPAFISGSAGFAVNFGADGPQSVEDGGAFNIVTGAVAGFFALNLTSKGEALEYSLSPDGSTLTAFVAGEGDAPDRTVFEFKISDSQTGDWEFRLFDQLDHEAPAGLSDENTNLGPNDISSLDFGQYITATDGDGDTVVLENQVNIAVRDDVPVLIKHKSEFVKVDEDDIQNGQSLGASPDDGNSDGSYTGAPNVNLGGAATVEGSLTHLVRSGADEALTFSFIGAEGAIAKLDALGLKSKGTELSFKIVGGVLTAYADEATDRDVFKLTLTEDGKYKFELFDQLDHDKPSYGADENFDLQDGVEGDVESINFGELIKASDHDGDSVILDGVFQVKIRDDVPELVKHQSEYVKVDEDDIKNSQSLGTSPDDGNSDGSYTGAPNVNLGGAATVEGSLSHLVRSGADEALTFSFIGAQSAIAKLDALGLKSQGTELSFKIVGGVLTAYADEATDRDVFKLTLNPDGTYKFELIDQLDHDKPSYGADENFDLQDDVYGDVESINFGELIKASDHDGDSVILDDIFQIKIRDDVPELVQGAKVYGVVEEEQLTQGGAGNEDTTASPDLDGDTPGNLNITTLKASGSLTSLIKTGADEALKFSFTDDVSKNDKIKDTSGNWVKSEGHSVYVDSVQSGSDAGGNYRILTAEADGDDVFTLKIYENGNWVFELKQEIDHHDFNDADDIEGYLGIDLSDLIKATDFDGDSVELGHGTFIVKVIDDVPILSGLTEIKTVNEDDISTPWSQGTSPHAHNQNDPENDGDNSYTDYNNSSADPAVVSGSLGNLVKAGADAPASFGFASDWKSTLEGLKLYSKETALPENGKLLTYTISGNTITAWEPNPDGNKVFELTLDSDGDYTFRLFDELIHVAGDGENTVLRSGPNGEVSGIDFGSIIKAYDDDGDSVSLDGKFIIKVKDDVPEAHISTKGAVIHDETAGNQSTGDADDLSSSSLSTAVKNLFKNLENGGTTGDDPDVSSTSGLSGKPIIGYARDQVVSTSSSEVGADAPAHTQTLVLKITGGEGVDSGLKTTEGNVIKLYMTAEGLIVGKVVGGPDNGKIAFAIALESNGDVSVAQYLSIKHDDRGDFNEDNDDGNGSNDDGENDTPNPLPQNLGGKVEVVLTIKDSDGDTDTDTQQIGDLIRFNDDGPTVSLEYKDGAKLVLDESLGITGSIQNEGDRANNDETEAGAANNAIGFATAAASALFNLTAQAGSDGGTPVFSLFAKSQNSGIFDTATGLEVKLSNDGAGKIVGKVGNAVVFTVEVDSTGKVSVNQFRAVKHNDSNDHDENSPSEVGIGTGKIEIKASITDGDGDKAEDTADLGKLIKFEDDGPLVTVSTVATTTTILTQDGDTLGDDFDTASGNFAGAFAATTNYGTDGAQGGVSWKYELDNTQDQGKNSGMTKDGAAIRIFEINGVIYGSTATGNNPSDNSITGNAVFKISVDSTGKVTLTQYAEIDHDAPGATSNYASQAEYLAAGLVKLIATATITDGDGDKSSAEKYIDLGGKIGFNDHGPDIDISGTTQVVEGNTAIGTWTRASGADDPANVTISINGGAAAAVSYGTPIVVGTLGTLTINANGTWSFASALNQDNDPTNPQLSFALTITDSDGDKDTDTQVVTIKDGTLSAGPAITLKLDDGNLVGGTTESDLDYASGQIVFTGSDNLASVVFGDTSALSPALNWVLVGTNQIIGYDSGVAVVQLDLSVNLGTKTATVTATLLDNYDSHPVLGDDVVALGSVKVVATDIDNTVANGTVNVTVSDDVPQLSISEVQPGALTVDETVFGTDATQNFSLAFTAFYGADGAHATQAVSYTLSVVAGNSGLVDTLTGQNVVLSVVGGVVFGKNTNGDEVFRITIDAGGTATLNQSRAVVHSDPSNHDEPTSLAGDLVKLTGTIKDADGDTDSETVNIGNKFVFEDDGPKVLGVTDSTSGSGLAWNGDFGDTTGGQQYDWGSIPASVTGWTVTASPTEPAGAPQFEFVDDGYQNMRTPAGLRMLDMGASPGNIQISQTVSGLTTGESYTLEFWAGAPHPATATLEVYFGGVLIGTIDPGPDMQLYSFTIQAGANTELTFRETGTGIDPIEGFATEGYHGTYLSQISIKTGAVLDDEAQTTPVDPGPDAIGIPGGPGDDPGALSSSTGKIYFDAGNDGLKAIAFTSVSANGAPLQAIFVDPVTGQGTPENVNAIWTQNPGDAGGTYTGTGVSGQLVFTIVVEADGDYKLTLYAPLAHSAEDDLTTGVVETSFEDNLGLTFGFKITDGDNDTAPGSFTVSVDDDSPLTTAPTVSEGPAGPNLLVNGSFEGSSVPAGDWGVVTSITGWNSAGGIGFEIQNNGVGGVGPHGSGISIVELDSDTGDRNATTVGAPTNATIQQTVATEAGATYEISFYYSPRPGDSQPDSSSMEVLWNGQVVKAISSVDQPDGWQLITVRVVATGASSTLGFHGTGATDEYGALIDDASLRLVSSLILDDEDTTRSPATEIQGGPGDDGSGVSASGNLNFNAGADGLKSVAFQAGGELIKAIYVDADGVGSARDVVSTWQQNGAGGVLTGKAFINGVDGDTFDVFTMTVAADGSYTFVLKAPLQHAAPSNDASYEDNLSFTLRYDVTDGDGDSVEGKLYISIDDDSPVVNQVEVLSFDTLALSDGAEGALNTLSPGYGGFTWSQVGVYNPTENNLGYWVNSETNLAFFGEANGQEVGADYPATAGSPIVIEKTDHSDFSFKGAWFTSAETEGLPITVTGYLNGVVVHTHTFPANTGGPVFVDFSTWGTIDKLEMDAPGYFGFDNFTFINAPAYQGGSTWAIVDEDALAAGNNDAAPGDDAGDASASGALGFQAGADGVSSVTFASMGGTAVVDASGAAVTSDGQALTYFWNGSTLYAAVDAASANDAGAAFKVQASTAGTYSFKLLKDVDHPAPLPAGQSAENRSENNISLKLVYTVTDGDGDALNGNLFVSIDDDTPVLAIAGTSASVNELVTVTGDWSVKGGADGASVTLHVDGVPHAVTYGIGIVLAGLGTLTIYAPDANGASTWNFAAGSVDGPKNFSFSLTATDGDGDISTDAHQVTINDISVPFTNAQPDRLIVEEEHLSDGNEDTGIPGDTGTDADTDVVGALNQITNEDATGALVITGGDGAKLFSFNVNDGAAVTFEGGAPVTSKGLPVLFVHDVDDPTLLHGAANGGGIVFTIKLNADGTFTFTLVDQIDHHPAGSADHVEGIKTIDLGGVFRVDDSDSDLGDVHVFQNIKVDVIDDVPVLSIPGGFGPVNENAVLNGNWGMNGGADDAATVTLSINGTPTVFTYGVGVTVTGLGTLTINAPSASGAGTWSFQANAVNGQKNFSFTLTAKDSDGDISAETVSVTINDTNTPFTNAQPDRLIVEEEHLAGGNEDTGVPADTGTDADTDTAGNSNLITNVDTTGQLTVTGGDGALTFSFNAENGTAVNFEGGGQVTSQGHPVTFMNVPGDATLINGVANGQTVFTIKLNADGSFKFTLVDQIDHHATGDNVEGIKTIDLSGAFKVTDADNDSHVFQNIKVDVIDDVPVANAISHTVVENAAKTNVVLILDRSGSMDDASGVGGLSRLDLMKQAIGNLLTSYDSIGDVQVKIVTFSDSAEKYTSIWVSVSQAQAYIDGLDADGNTNYDAAVNLVRTDAFDDTGAFTGPGAQSVSYFFSDGEPNPNGSGLDSGETTTWQNFVNGAEIVSYAIGLGTGVSSTALNPVAYDGRAAGTDTNAIIVTDLSQLNATLLGTVTAPVSGSLVSGSMAGFGADGGYVSSITIDGKTFDYSKQNDAITVSGGGTPTHSFDTGANKLTITLGGGESFVVDLDDGSYTYTPPTNITADAARQFGFTLRDGDGDSSSSTLTINLDDVPPPPVVAISNGTSTVALADAGNVAVDAATEGNYVYFQLSLTSADAGDITVKLSTTDNDAGNGSVGGNNGGTDGDDFNTVLEYSDNNGASWQTATAGNVTFLAGKTEIIVRVQTLITGDDSSEPEAFRVNIDSIVSGNATVSTVDNAPNGGIGNTGEGQIDAALSVSVANASDVTEGNSLQFTVSLNAASTTAVLLNLAFAGTSGTAATAGSDFQTSYFYSTDNGANWIGAAGNQAPIPAGQTSILVRVDTINDTADEPDNEQLTLTVTMSSNNAVIADGTGTGHIDDNDIPPNALPVLKLNGFGPSASITETFESGYNSGSGWSGNWTEAGDDNTTSGGDIRIVEVGGSGNDVLRLRDDDGNDDSIARSFNLNGASSASLTLKYQRLDLDDANDEVRVEIYDGTNWHTVLTIEGGANDNGLVTTSPIDLTQYIPASGNMQIRFVADSDLDTSDTIRIDDIVIQYTPKVSQEDYTTTFTEDGAAVSIAGAGPTITDNDGSIIDHATIVLTNAKAGDVLAVGTLLGGITASIDNSIPGKITVTLSGDSSFANYQKAIAAVTFENISDNPSTTPREIDVTVTDNLGGTSAPATATINVTPTNDPFTANDDTIITNIADFSTINIPTKALLFNDSDPDQNATVTGTSGAFGGTVINNLPSDIVFDPNNPSANPVFTATFNSGATNSFDYADERFVNVDGDANDDANGTSTGGVLHLDLGGNDGSNEDDVNGGFLRTFNLTAAAVIAITFSYRAQLSAATDNDEDVQVLARIDGTTHTVKTLEGGNSTGAQDTGWKTVTITASLGAGDHTLTLGGLLTEKSETDEYADIDFDNVTVKPIAGGAFDYTANGGNVDNGHVDVISVTGSTLTGTENGEVMLAGNGNDTLNGLGGADYLIGGGGDDILLGGLGNDALAGGAGKDTLTGGDGADTFIIDPSALDNVTLPDIIADYDFAEGDVIDLTDLFNTNGGDLDAFVRLDGTGSYLQVDSDGASGGANFENIVHFQAPLPANATIAILFTDSTTGSSDDSGTV